MDPLTEAEAKMRDDGQPEAAIAVFRHAFEALAAGDAGVLPTGALTPVEDPPRIEDLPEAPAEALGRTVVIKLNGGLGTTMGLTRAKSLIRARGERTFLDLIVAHVEAARQRHGAELPLVLLDSFRTRADTQAAVGDRPGVRSLLQHREPRLRAGDRRPLSVPGDPDAEWCPPGHGDVYLALHTSGLLDELLERGFRQAFLSNADNLGAALEPRVAAWMAAERLPFVMEVVRGTAADRKGGHVARREDGRLVLRETAQVPPGEEESFRDVGRWRFYNSNNLWVDLEALRERLARDPVLGLPLIVNRKSVGDAEVLQLETAMGAALGVFDGAALLEVPRTRFAPVKSTDDLLAVRSDAYTVTDDARVVPAGDGVPFIELDRDTFGTLEAFEERFAEGPPSLAACERLVVRGDVRFGAGVRVEGDVTIEGPARIPDGEVLRGG